VCVVGHGGLHGLVDATLVYEVASIGAGRRGRECCGEIHVVSVQNKNKKCGRTLYARPLIVSTAPLPAPRVFDLLCLRFVVASCSCGRKSTARDLITLTGNSRDTRQTRVTGAGWARVTKSQPIPGPAGTRGTNPHGFVNP